VKVIVDQARCVGHARCAAAAPEVFELDDNGYIAFAERRVPAGLEAQAQRGARACPERIITIVAED